MFLFLIFVMRMTRLLPISSGLLLNCLGILLFLICNVHAFYQVSNYG